MAFEPSDFFYNLLKDNDTGSRISLRDSGMTGKTRVSLVWMVHNGVWHLTILVV
jgi:hypothetical protein